MKQKVQIFRYGTFLKRFALEDNHLDIHALDGGCLYETFGAELTHVLAVYHRDPARVWTLTDYNETLYVEQGFHLVNRLGYFITKK